VREDGGGQEGAHEVGPVEGIERRLVEHLRRRVRTAVSKGAKADKQAPKRPK
jgi:hypothetical protein